MFFHLPIQNGVAKLRVQEALIDEIQRGLTVSPRRLAPWIFYDKLGSGLFEQITRLPEYYPTRIEREILARHARSIILATCAGTSRPLRVVELGAGTASKTDILLDAAVQIQAEVLYLPIDVSADALTTACNRISASMRDIRIEPTIANYVTHPPQLKSFAGITLVLYIGSSIGNFLPLEARSILADMRSQLIPGDALLLGVDLVKDLHTLISAYDDSQGMTAAFNVNMLHRINHELGADFNLDGFRHRIEWNVMESRIEMHLESLYKQEACIPLAGLSVSFSEGETIHTENSYKFTQERIRGLFEDSGLVLEYGPTIVHGTLLRLHVFFEESSHCFKVHDCPPNL